MGPAGLAPFLALFDFGGGVRAFRRACRSSIVRSAMSRGMWPGFSRRVPGPAASGSVFFRSETMSR